ncbi:hypothetical protein [Spongiactinospora sp. 9N601]|uniref:hypothetical protein n=1 Tax=Spongiactinospora sp. 9N601 TaxID=3375149 RepID=UPI0037A95C2D
MDLAEDIPITWFRGMDRYHIGHVADPNQPLLISAPEAALTAPQAECPSPQDGAISADLGCARILPAQRSTIKASPGHQTPADTTTDGERDACRTQGKTRP